MRLFWIVTLLGSQALNAQTSVNCNSVFRSMIRASEDSDGCNLRAIGNQIGVSANQPSSVLASPNQRTMLGEGSTQPMAFTLSRIHATARYRARQTHGHDNGTWSTTGIIRIDRATGQLEMRNTTWNNDFRRVTQVSCFRGSDDHIIVTGFNSRDRSFLQLSFNPPSADDFCPG
ncbi:MAG: hypothetical protein HRU19_23335 [Pseudobacteriovorax sp.]|nr:hypothetical protein [Pseudobacteriovorax sp.]